MSEQGGNKSFVKNMVKAGKVKELRKRYELASGRQNIMLRSKSEPFLIKDVSEETNSNGQFTQWSSSSKSTKPLKRTPSEVRKNKKDYNLISEASVGNYQNYLINTNLEKQGKLGKSTGTLPRDISMSKRPIPAPRVHTLPRKQRPENSESNNLQDVNAVLNTTFIQASQCGNMENLRANLLRVLDDLSNGMEELGYNGENICSTEESNDDSERDELDSDETDMKPEDELADDHTYINLTELMGYKERKNKIHPRYENVSNQIISVNKNIDKNAVKNWKYQTNSPKVSFKEKSTDEPDIQPEDEVADDSTNLTEVLGYKKKKNDIHPYYQNLSNQTISVYTNMDKKAVNNGKYQANCHKFRLKDESTTEMDWNIPPTPDGSLKPATYFDQSKNNIACSLHYDGTDDENYEPINSNSIVKIKHEEAISEDFLKADQPECDKNKLSKIVHEFKETEQRYLQELNDIIPVYKYGIKNHSSLAIRTKAELICTTIDKLLEIQTEFGQIMKTLDNSIEVILRVFIDFEELFITYKQCLGTNSSITVTVGVVENDFKKEINLPSVLNQRLTHYKMFLERIKREVAKQNDPKIFEVVLYLLNAVMDIINSCNTMLLLATVQNIPLKTNKYGSLYDVREAPSSPFIQCCPFDVSGYGDFLLKDRFKISKPFSMELTVILFNNIILFTMEEQKDSFYYHSHVKMNDVLLCPMSKRDVLKFQHFSISKRFHSPSNYKLKSDAKTVQKWRKHISDCLWTQNLIIKEKATKSYKKTVTKFIVDI